MPSIHVCMKKNTFSELTDTLVLVWPASPLSPFPGYFEFYTINLSIMKERGSGSSWPD
jgi:hypothetical protein